jgi:hypothetical protein
MVRVTTTHEFLKSKLQNLRRALIEQYKANTVRIDTLESHLLTQSNLTSYASKLKGKDLRSVAEDIVNYVETSDNRDDAVELTVKYLSLFQEVTDNLNT